MLLLLDFAVDLFVIEKVVLGFAVELRLVLQRLLAGLLQLNFAEFLPLVGFPSDL